MKKCPYCGEENLDFSTVCYYCGRDLPLPPDDVEPTQPNRVQRPPQAGSPQPYQPSPGDNNPTQPYLPPQPGYTQPGQYGGQSYDSQYGQPGQPYSEPYGQTQAQPPSSGRTGYTQPYAAQPSQYPQQAPYPQNAYPPNPPYPPGYGNYGQPAEPLPPARSRMWIIAPLLIGLLLCVCLVAAWAVLDTTNRGVARLGDQISTRAAGIFGPPATQTPSDPVVALPETPTLWPTFTPEVITDTPVPPVADTPVPEPETTEENSDYTDRLLSPECRAALDHLSGLTGQLSTEPLKLLEEAWRNEFNQARADLNTYCGTLDAASPVPGRVQAAHQALTTANQEFDLANQLFQEAVAGPEPAKFLQAAQHFGEAARNLTNALAEIRKVVE